MPTITQTFATTLGAGLLVLAVGSMQRAARRRRSRLALVRLCGRLPKVELHAHLHGSARLSTIAALAPDGVDISCLQSIRGTDRSLESCFAIFGAIHKTVTNVAAVRRVTLEVLEDFAADGVRYLELRTTPRVLSDADVAGYVDCVIDAFSSFERSQRDRSVNWLLLPRLLLSVDRSGTLEQALATVRLALGIRKSGSEGSQYIVGIDFSGNPTRGSFVDFLPAFELARSGGLAIAVHVAELDNRTDTEAVLTFRPERLGHALTLDAGQISRLIERSIPIEICPTSNMKTMQLSRLREHPTLSTWLGSGYPISINTDDSTVFETTSSQELLLVAEVFALAPETIVALCLGALKHTFEADAQLLRMLHKHFRVESERALLEFHTSL